MRVTKSKLKKGLAMLLAVVMLFSVLPVSAFAEDGDIPEETYAASEEMDAGTSDIQGDSDVVVSNIEQIVVSEDIESKDESDEEGADDGEAAVNDENEDIEESAAAEDSGSVGESDDPAFTPEETSASEPPATPEPTEEPTPTPEPTEEPVSTPVPADKEISVGQAVNGSLTTEQDTYTIRLTVGSVGRLKMTLTGGVSIDMLDEQTNEDTLSVKSEKDESGEWTAVEEIINITQGTYYITVSAVDSLTAGSPCEFSIIFENYVEPVSTPEPTEKPVTESTEDPAEDSAEESVDEHPLYGLATGSYGYANAAQNVCWTEYEMDGAYTLLFSVNDPAPGGEACAITQLVYEDGTSAAADLRSRVTRIVLEDGITGLGWTYLYRRGDGEPSWPADYPVNPGMTDIFRSFTALTEVIPCASLERIGWSAFRDCSSLSNFDFTRCPNLIEILNQAFYNCSSLNTVDLSACSGLVTLGWSCFNGAGRGSSVRLALPALSSLEVIGGYAFYGFGRSAGDVSVDFTGVSATVTRILQNAFNGSHVCGELNGFERLTEIGSSAFKNSCNCSVMPRLWGKK